MKYIAKIGSEKIYGYETGTMPSWEAAVSEWGKIDQSFTKSLVFICLL